MEKKTKTVKVIAWRDCEFQKKKYTSGDAISCTEDQAKGLEFHNIAGKAKTIPKVDETPIADDNLLLKFIASDNPIKDFTVDELKSMAKACGVKGYHAMTEGALANAISSWLNDPKNRKTK